MNCYVCEREITPDIETEEHILLNAAGGRLKSRKLICKDCNSKFGGNIDGKLAKQLNFLSNMLMVKRDRGLPQPIEGICLDTGEEYQVEQGGNLMMKRPKIEKDEECISIKARGMTELRRILNGFAKKYEGFNVEDAMKSVQPRTFNFNNVLNFTTEVGGRDVFRAICKCAVNYYVFKQKEYLQIKHLIPYIKGDIELDNVWMHYQNNVYNIDLINPSHIIHLVGNSKEKILYCYVDYFNTYRYLVLLNKEYEGDDINDTYCYDLINASEQYIGMNLNYDRNTLLDFFTNKEVDFSKKIELCFNHSIEIGRKLQLQERIKDKVHEFLKRYPENTLLTEEIISEFEKELRETIIPCILRRGNNGEM